MADFDPALTSAYLSNLANNIRAIQAVNPAVTVDQLASGFGVPTDTINSALNFKVTPETYLPGGILDTASWDPKVAAYYQQLKDYSTKLSGMGFSVIDPRQEGGFYDQKTGMYVPTRTVPGLPGVTLPNMYGPENQGYYSGAMGQYADPSQFYQTVMNFQAQMGKNENPSYFGSIVADPNAQYKLTDKSGETVYSGTGYEALAKMKSLIPDMSTKESDVWNISVLNPTTQQWEETGARKINSADPFFIKAFPYVLGALATAGALGAFGGAGGAAGGAGGGAGAAGAGAGAAGAGAAGAGAAGAGAAGAAALAPVLGDIVVTGALPAATSIGGTLAGIGAGVAGGLAAASGAAPSAASGTTAAPQTTQPAPTLEQQFDTTFGAGTSQAPAGGLAAVDPLTGELTVTAGGVPGIGAGNLANAVGAASGALSGVSGAERLDQLQTQPTDQTAQQTQQPTENVDTTPITVSSRPPALDLIGPAPVVTVSPGALSSIENTAPPIPEQTQQPTENVDTTPITVSHPPLDITGPPPVVTVPPGAIQDVVNQTNPTQTDPTKKLIDDIITALKAAGIISSVIGGATSGGSGSGSGTIPSGLAADKALAPIFSARLPAAQPQFTAGLQTTGPGLGGASPHIQNWIVPYTTSAAEAPSMSVMPSVQSVEDLLAKGALKGVDALSEDFRTARAHGGYMGYAHGGGSTSSFAVEGPGDGRSDDIPAQLSDGEYVMDAETVALLGNGSSKAGAKRLDQFRANIRKQKGAKLARGQFSVKAREPQAYLTGGRI